MPALEAAPPEPGNGLASVVISTNVPASVVELVGGASQLRCAETPCALTMPYGDHELGFAALKDNTRQSTAILHIAHAAVVMNHALGQDKVNPGQGVGAAFMVIGAITLGVALGIAQSAQEHGEQADPALGGIAIGGLSGIVLGGIVTAASPSTHQDGATTQWAPEAPPAGVRVGVKF